MLASHYFNEYELEAGCDEAGRGCLAGSVYAAAVVFPKDYHNEELNDSKSLRHTGAMNSVRSWSVMHWPGPWVWSLRRRLTR